MSERKSAASDLCPGQSARTATRRKHGEPVTARGHVTRLYVSEPRYSAGRFKTVDGVELTFSGRFMVAERDPLVLVGHWLQHPRFGQQLKVDSFQFDHAGNDEDPKRDSP